MVALCVRACMLSCFSHVQLLATLWTVAHQAPLSMRFSRQEYQSGLPCPPPGDIPHPGIKPTSPAWQADSLPLSHQESPMIPLTHPLWSSTIKKKKKQYYLDTCLLYSLNAAAAAAKSLQSCPTLCDPINSSPPGFPVPGILQARTLEWVAMPSSRGYSRPRDQTQVSCISCIGRRVFYQ